MLSFGLVTKIKLPAVASKSTQSGQSNSSCSCPQPTTPKQKQPQRFITQWKKQNSPSSIMTCPLLPHLPHLLLSVLWLNMIHSLSQTRMRPLGAGDCCFIGMYVCVLLKPSNRSVGSCLYLCQASWDIHSL